MGMADLMVVGVMVVLALGGGGRRFLEIYQRGRDTSFASNFRGVERSNQLLQCAAVDKLQQGVKCT